MVRIGSITINPPLLNSSSPYAALHEIQLIVDSPPQRKILKRFISALLRVV
jgi:hypothetical protein